MEPTLKEILIFVVGGLVGSAAMLITLGLVWQESGLAQLTARKDDMEKQNEALSARIETLKADLAILPPPRS